MKQVEFEEHELADYFDAVTYRRGADYQRLGKVIELRRKGKELYGTVRGSSRQPYEQVIQLARQDAEIDFRGVCSCPMGYNCKHVVAVLLEAYVGGDARRPAPRSAPVVPDALASWLDQFAKTLAAGRPQAVRPAATHRMAYVLAPDRSGQGVELLLCKARLRKNGTVVSASVLAETYSILAYRPEFVQVEDLLPIRLFVAMRSGSEWADASCAPSETLGAQLLLLLADSGRLHQVRQRSDLKLGLLHAVPRGPMRNGGLGWVNAAAAPGRQTLGWQFDNGEAMYRLLPTTPMLYLNDGKLGELGLNQELAALPLREWHQLIAGAPLLSAADAAPLARAVAARGLQHLLPAPSLPKQTLRTDVSAQPFLLLGCLEAADDNDGQDFAILAFDYDGVRVSADGQQQPLHRDSAAGSEVIERDNAGEAAARAAMQYLGFQPHQAAPLRDMHGAFGMNGVQDWRRFARQEMAGLLALGWQIERAPSYRYDILEVDEWYAEVGEGEGGGGQAWFDLELGIVLDGRRVPLLPLLLQLIQQAPQQFAPDALAAYGENEQLVARLDDGARVALPWSRIRPILETLGELYFIERIGSALRLPLLDAARLAELEAGAQTRWVGGDRTRDMGRRLARFGGIEAVAAPAGLQAELRPYQGEGLAWMQFLREYDLAGILADDMGLGKTLQTLAHILLEKEAGRLDAPALVVAPTSLMANWQAEAARFAPGLSVLVLHGPDRAAQFDQIGSHDLVLTSYALLPRDEATLLQQRFHLLVLDESQYIKNHRAQAAQTAGLLNARHRLCLTGTPLQNHLGELWSQFHFLLPGLLGDEKSFNADFRKPIEKQGDTVRNSLLTRRIKPFLLRRTKDVVATELPPKTEIVRDIELVGQQRDLYETVRLAMDKKVRAEIARKGVARSQIVILEALLKLRQVCCDPRLVTLAAGRKSRAPSAKLVELMRMIEELLAEGRKILVFSQFTSMLALIEEQLRERAIGYALLTGETKQRGAQVAAFQQGAVPLFLISLKAGGVGLNLTAADTVIHYDPWWNPAAENQASDRAWRIGQDKPVFVYKLIAKGTLEEKIQALQRDKAALADAVLADGAIGKLTITQDDLRGIFAPL